MRYVWPWFVVAMALGTGPARSEEAASRVSVPLSEYEALKKSLERSSVTVVDTLRLSGSFGRRDLHVVLSGRSAGTLPPVDVIANAAGIVIFGCDGDGILSRGGEGVFRLTPLAGRLARS